LGRGSSAMSQEGNRKTYGAPSRIGFWILNMIR
jgi:hypothetical protein